jgi:hypothetical protein
MKVKISSGTRHTGDVTHVEEKRNMYRVWVASFA